ncbi:MAG: serine/threonine-protein kinase, partial [Polyangiaceae bacterium]
MTQPGAEQLAGVHEGEILDGKYRVDRVLGVGGMGAVVAAYDVRLETKVAIKFLLPHVLANRESLTRFSDEAKREAMIPSEHIARVLNVGTLDNGAPYKVMEFLDGSDLAAWLRQRGPLLIDQAVEFVLQASVAVADAHGLGIVHRDLKPANLFCTRRSDGRFIIKVLDFGISKLTDARGSSEPTGMSVTQPSAVMGSPLYMSPEQIESSKAVDARTDIWALGVILFELVTGSVPFPGETFGEITRKIFGAPAPALRVHRRDAPPELEAVIFRCLAKDRQQRYPNVGDLALALQPFAPKRAKELVDRILGIIRGEVPLDRTPASPPLPPPSEETQVTPPAGAPWSGPSDATASNRKVAWILAGAGALGAVGASRWSSWFPAESRSLDGGPAVFGLAFFDAHEQLGVDGADERLVTLA